MCKWGDVVELTPPEGMAPNRIRNAGKPIIVDRCIAPAVLALWSAGIATVGSCCGHGSWQGKTLLPVATEGGEGA